LVELQGVQPHLPVGASREGGDHRAVDGHGQHKALIVVGVLADEVHSPWRFSQPLGLSGEAAGEAAGDGALTAAGCGSVHGLAARSALVPWLEGHTLVSQMTAVG